MIRKLEVKGLNNRIDGAWEFNEDLNIVTGRNGSGKTTLLKLIWYLFSGNLGQAISEIAFQSVTIEADSFSLDLARNRPDEGSYRFAITAQGTIQGSFKIPLKLDDFQRFSKPHRLFTRLRNRSLFFPSFRRIEGGFDYLSQKTGSGDLKWIFAHNDPKWRSADEGIGVLEKAMSQLSSDLTDYGRHQFVAAISTRDLRDLLTPKYCAILKETDEPYTKLLNEVTKTAEKILKKITERKPLDNVVQDLVDIQQRIEGLNIERQSLLKPFSALGETICDILQYEGIRMTDEIILGEEHGAIDSDQLSAGEKQMLSFLCYNSFSENAAIFIDEPELSLHVDWQRLLLPTLLEQKTGNQFFVATHSPFIYAKYPDKEILIGEDRGGN